MTTMVTCFERAGVLIVDSIRAEGEEVSIAYQELGGLVMGEGIEDPTTATSWISGDMEVERDGSSVTISGEATGIGNGEQLDATVTITADCPDL